MYAEWEESLPSEKRPPRHIWRDHELLKQWFDREDGETDNPNDKLYIPGAKRNAAADMLLID